MRTLSIIICCCVIAAGINSALSGALAGQVVGVVTIMAGFAGIVLVLADWAHLNSLDSAVRPRNRRL
jgi:putative effector of murein hydrolase LrgA (UPF0299 family)